MIKLRKKGNTEYRDNNTQTLTHTHKIIPKYNRGEDERYLEKEKKEKERKKIWCIRNFYEAVCVESFNHERCKWCEQRLEREWRTTRREWNKNGEQVRLNAFSLACSFFLLCSFIDLYSFYCFLSLTSPQWLVRIGLFVCECMSECVFFVLFYTHTYTHQLTQEMHKIVIEHMKECVTNPYVWG